ncbi:MAG TPA: VWA domain-containing protein, partial [Bryobacteraceae bacterium]|nr:VWA domain-containing protein [Bryobacteraceae bacterium]
SAQDAPVFQAEVSRVHVDAEVLTPAGRVVTALTSKDFRIYDEGTEQRILACRTDEEPLDIILLLDKSGSMRRAPQKLATAAHSAFAELRSGDRVALMTFDSSGRLVSPFTQDLQSIERDLQALVTNRLEGDTRIHQAVDDAAHYFLQEPRTQRRRTILIITDNVGTRTVSEAHVVNDLWEADAVLSGVIFNQPGFEVRRAIVAVLAPYALIRAGKGIGHMTDKTGGDTIHVEEPGTAFAEMMRRIRSRYSLYYATPEGKPGSFRSIRVQLAPEPQKLYPGARILARRGYRLQGSR